MPTELKRAPLILVLALLAGPTIAGAATVWVAQERPGASDENPGSAEAPWKSIGRGVAALRPGDTLYVGRGTYREQVVLTHEPWTVGGASYAAFPAGDGREGMTRILAMPGEEVTIKGSDELPRRWKVHQGAVWVFDDWGANSQQLFCDGVGLRQIGGTMAASVSGAGHYLGRVGAGLADLRAGSFTYDEGSRKLYAWLADGGDPNTHRMEAAARPLLLTLHDVTRVEVRGFRFRHSNTSALVNWAAVTVSGSSHLLEDLDIAECDFGGINLAGSDTTLIRCRANDCGNNGITGTGRGHRLIACETSRNNTRHWLPGWHAGGVKFTLARDVVVSGHRAEDNRGQGIWFDVAATQVTVRNSVCSGNAGQGLLYEISERGALVNNISVKNREIGIYVSNSSTTTVAHNLCMGNGRSGIVVIGVRRKETYGRAGDGILPARDNLVWGNILADNCDPSLSGAEYADWPELILPDPSPELNRGNASDYNLFYRDAGRPLPFGISWERRLSDLAGWRRITGYDRHSIVALPIFVDAKALDFHPAAGSPALDLARPLMTVQDDFDGAPRDPAKNQAAGPFAPPSTVKVEAVTPGAAPITPKAATATPKAATAAPKAATVAPKAATAAPKATPNSRTMPRAALPPR